MANWTSFTNQLDPDQPARSVDVKAINENISALAEGAAGAPKIQSSAIETSYGGIGSYAFLRIRTATAITPGSSVSGSSLTPGALFASGGTNTAGGFVTGASITSNDAALSGTWRVMGTLNFASGSTQDRFTLFLRIA